MGWRRWGRLLGAGVLGLLVLLLPAALLGPAGAGETAAGAALSAGRSAADAAADGPAGEIAATAAPGGQTSPDETAGETSGQTAATAGLGGQTSPDETAGQTVAFPAGEYRAVWVSYLEWQRMDFSDAAAFRADAAAMLDDIAGLGANVVLAHVRPFGDALYPSELFPWSHLAAGVQGRDPGFDPLAILVQAAHDRGLQLEAWVNPYRLQAGGVPEPGDGSLAAVHPDWVRRAGDGLYLDPAEPRVRAYIAAGVAELCAGYILTITSTPPPTRPLTPTPTRPTAPAPTTPCRWPTGAVPTWTRWWRCAARPPTGMGCGSGWRPRATRPRTGTPSTATPPAGWPRAGMWTT